MFNPKAKIVAVCDNVESKAKMKAAAWGSEKSDSHCARKGGGKGHG